MASSASINDLRLIVGKDIATDEVLHRALVAASGDLNIAAQIFFDLQAITDSTSPAKHATKSASTAQTDCIDLDSDGSDDIEIVGVVHPAAVPAAESARFASPPRSSVARRNGTAVGSHDHVPVHGTPGGQWPKALSPVQVEVTSILRAPANLYTHTLVVWHEMNAAGHVTVAKSKGAHFMKQVIAKSKGEAGHDGAEGTTPEYLQDTNVRVALVPATAAKAYLSAGRFKDPPTGVSALGRLPPHLARALSPLLDEGSVRVHGQVVSAPDTVNVGSTLTLLLTVEIMKHARRLMRFRRRDVQSSTDGEQREGSLEVAQGLDRIGGRVATAAEQRLRGCLFDVVYYSLHGKPTPQPKLHSKGAAGSASAYTSAPPSAVQSPVPAQASSAAPTSEEPDGEGGPDNEEERVDASVVQAVLDPKNGADGATDSTVLALPIALQPVNMRNVQMRPYQLQALAWCRAREQGRDLTGETDDRLGRVGATDQSTGAGGGTVEGNGQQSSLVMEAQAAAKQTSSAAASTFQDSMWESLTFDDYERTPLWLNPFNRCLSLAPPPKARPCRGGIIADEMGLGKTAELVSVIVEGMERKRWIPVSSVGMSNASSTTGRGGEQEGAARTRRAAMADDVDATDDECSSTSGESTSPSDSGSLLPDDEDHDSGHEEQIGAGKKRPAKTSTGGVSKVPRQLSAASDVSAAAHAHPPTDQPLSQDVCDEDDGVHMDMDAVDAAGTKLLKVRATLVVAPMVMMSQWVKEIEKYTQAPSSSSVSSAAGSGVSTGSAASIGLSGTRIFGQGLRVLLHYGPTRARDPSIFSTYDVVVTSYGTVASEYEASVRQAQLQVDALTETARLSTGSVAGLFNKLGKPAATSTKVMASSANAPAAALSGRVSPLYSVRWERLALDEAHTIKNRVTKTAKACFELRATYRWCLTGTPIQNSLQDLYSLLRFLRHEPWSELNWWKHVLAEPFERKDPRALRMLQGLLRPILLRRTKNMNDVDGRLILGDLPPPDISVVSVELSEQERGFYGMLYQRSKAQFQGIVATKRVISQYAQIFTLLLRLRQACDHPLLVLLGAGAVSNTGLSGGPGSAGTGSAASAADDDAEEAAATDGAESDFIQKLYERWLSDSKSRKQAPATPGLAAATEESADSTQPEHEEEDSNPASGQAFAMTQLDALRAAGLSQHECAVCLDSLQEDTCAGLPCAHLLCTRCVLGLTRIPAPGAVVLTGSADYRQCPVCRKAFEIRSVVTKGRSTRLGLGAQAHGGRVSIGPGESLAAQVAAAAALGREALRDHTRPDVPSSTKLQLLKDQLLQISAHNVRYSEWLRTNATQLPQDGAGAPTLTTSPSFTSVVGGMTLTDKTKVVVFSQFTGMLDLIERTLKQASNERVPGASTAGPALAQGFTRLDGSMSQKARDEAIAAFRDERAGARTFVFLISLKAGGVGLNLTEANVLYLIDPWWNPSVEWQALARVHRMGQKKQVYVRRFVTERTVEVQMLEIQEKKRVLADSALAAGTGAGSSGSQANKLTEEDMRLFFAR